MRKYIATLIIVSCALRIEAQTEEGLLTARKLVLETAIADAVRYNNELLSCATGYTFKYVDNESKSELKYLYEHTSGETLRIDYAFRQGTDNGDKPTKLIFSQRITADNKSMAFIYNCTFGTTAKPEELEVFSGMTVPFVYNDKSYHYTLIPDDYKPGYWVLTFTQ